MKLTRDLASHFARTALGHVTREWPNKMDHVLMGPEDVKGPRELHPIFFGSFDWHSCVHSHWLLAKLYRLYPDLPEASAIRAMLDSQFTAEKVAGEVAYLTRPSARGFERPYGWAWLLMLQGELARHKRGYTLGRYAEAAGGCLRATVPRLPAAGDLSGARRGAFQHRLRPDPGAGLCRRRGGCGFWLQTSCAASALSWYSGR